MNLLKFSLLLVCCIGGANCSAAIVTNANVDTAAIASTTIQFSASLGANPTTPDTLPCTFEAKQVDGTAYTNADNTVNTVAAATGALDGTGKTWQIKDLTEATEYVFTVADLKWTCLKSDGTTGMSVPVGTKPPFGNTYLTIRTLPKNLAASDFTVTATKHMVTLVPGTLADAYGTHYAFVSASTNVGTEVKIDSNAMATPSYMVAKLQTMNIKGLKSGTKYTVIINNFVFSNAYNAVASKVKAATELSTDICTDMAELNYKKIKAEFKKGTKGLTLSGTSGAAGNEFVLHGDNNGPLASIEVTANPSIEGFTPAAVAKTSEFRMESFVKSTKYVFTVKVKAGTDCPNKESITTIDYDGKGKWSVGDEVLFGEDKNGSMGLTGSSALLVALVAALFA